MSTGTCQTPGGKPVAAASAGVGGWREFGKKALALATKNRWMFLRFCCSLLLLSVLLNYLSSEARELLLGRVCLPGALVSDALLLLLGSGLLLFIFSVYRYGLPTASGTPGQGSKRFRDAGLKTLLVAVGFAAFLAISVAAVDLYSQYLLSAGARLCGPMRFVVWLAAAAAMFLVLDFFRFHSKSLMRVQSDSHAQISTKPVKVLVLPVSLPTGLAKEMSEAAKTRCEESLKTVMEAKSLDPARLNGEEPIRNWTQLLRAVDRHRDNLETIVLVGSSGENGGFGSHEFLELAKELLARFLGASASGTSPSTEGHTEGADMRNVSPPKIVRYDKPVCFSDINALLGCFGKIVTDYSREKAPWIKRWIGLDRDDTRVAREELCIEVTGGMKPLTCAGALISSLYGGTSFQYVDTNSAVIHRYKCAVISPPTGGVTG